MRPGFRPILPGMHGGVGADEILLPAYPRPGFVVSLQRLLIVLAFIAEGIPEVSKVLTIGDQHIPIIVPYLMAKMPQKSAVGLFLQSALPLSVHIICLGNINGDQSIIVSRKHAFRVAVGRGL